MMFDHNTAFRCLDQSRMLGYQTCCSYHKTLFLKFEKDCILEFDLPHLHYLGPPFSNVLQRKIWHITIRVSGKVLGWNAIPQSTGLFDSMYLYVKKENSCRGIENYFNNYSVGLHFLSVNLKLSPTWSAVIHQQLFLQGNMYLLKLIEQEFSCLHLATTILFVCMERILGKHARHE